MDGYLIAGLMAVWIAWNLRATSAEANLLSRSLLYCLPELFGWRAGLAVIYSLDAEICSLNQTETRAEIRKIPICAEGNEDVRGSPFALTPV